MFPNCFKLDKGELCLFRLSLSVEGSFFLVVNPPAMC